VEEKENERKMSNLAETGRLLLEGMSLGENELDSDDVVAAPPPENRRSQMKRQISDRTYKMNTPGAEEVKLQRVNFLGARKPGVQPRMWTAEEDELLRASVKKHGEKNWRKISDEIPNRSHLQCLQRWKKALRPGLVKGHWSKEEDAKLLELIQKFLETGNVQSINWQSICQEVEGRNAKQCRERWFLNLDPSINRGPWTAEEDKRLLELAAQCGGRWALIAKNMDGRTENSVKTRYHSLMRQEARNRGWTQQEDNTLIQAVLLFGRNWRKVIKQLPGRSSGQVKKRFASITQNRPEIVQRVQQVEESIERGEIKPPNPPPAPIKPISPQFLNATGIPETTSHQDISQTWKPGMQASGGSYQQPSSQANPQEQKGLYKKHGSSWLAGIGDSLEPSNPSQLRRTNSQKVLSSLLGAQTSDGIETVNTVSSHHQAQPPATIGVPVQTTLNRHETSNLAMLDKLLGSGGAPPTVDISTTVYSNNTVYVEPGSEIAIAPGEVSTDNSKDLKQYSSWGSLGGGQDFQNVFNDTGAPNVLRAGSNKSLPIHKMSSNWGPPPPASNGTHPGLTSYDTSDLKSFMNLL